MRGRLTKDTGRTLLVAGVLLMFLLQAVPLGVVASHTSAHNNAPVIDPVANKTVFEKETIGVKITASDADSDPLIFEAVKLPAGAQFQQNTTTLAYFEWTPTYQDAGIHEVTVKVRDEWSTDTETFYIEVIDVNRPPVLDEIRNKWLYELDNLAFDMTASDPDADPLNWSLEAVPTTVHDSTDLPLGVFFEPKGNRAGFAWQPNCSQGLPGSPSTGGGARYQFIANVTDGGLNASRQFNITVYDVPAPPELVPIPHHLALEGTELSFTINATACDAKDHYLEVGLVKAQQDGLNPPPLPSPLPNKDLPDGITIDTETPDPMKIAGPLEYFSYFNWTIGFQQAGNYTFYANVTDADGLSDNRTFTIRITPFNTAPSFNLLPDFHYAPTQTYWGKEDTRFNMTSPLGSFISDTGCDWDATDPWPHALDGFVPCGTPFRVNVTDEQNDIIFWQLFWDSFNGQAVGGSKLPAGVELRAPGANWTKGGGDPSRPTMPAAPANESGALLLWNPDYAQAGTYGFTIWAGDGLNFTSASFNISVENTNRRPMIDLLTSHLTVNEGEEITVDAKLTDRDLRDLECPWDSICDQESTLSQTGIEFLAGNVTHGRQALPAGLQWQQGRVVNLIEMFGSLSWTPGYHQAGIYEIMLFADDSTEDYLFPLNPLGYGNHSGVNAGEILNPTVIPTPWAFPGFGPDEDPNLNTEFYNLYTFRIEVLNVDRPPVLDPITDVTLHPGAGLHIPLFAVDPDGDPITLTQTGLPGFATLTDNGDGTGLISGFSSVADAGVYPVEVKACAGVPAACDIQTFVIVVLADTEYSVRSTSFVHQAAPGVPLRIPIKVENTGPADPDQINLELVFQDGLTGTLDDTSLLVASEDTEWTNATVIVPADVDSSFLSIRATSTVDPSYSKVATVRVDVPVVIGVTMSSTTPGLIQGIANATFLDGSPVINKTISVKQSPSPNPLDLASSSVSGATDAAGEFVFEFGPTHPTASLPGTHQVDVTVLYGGGQYFGDGSYTV